MSYEVSPCDRNMFLPLPLMGGRTAHLISGFFDGASSSLHSDNPSLRPEWHCLGVFLPPCLWRGMDPRYHSESKTLNRRMCEVGGPSRGPMGARSFLICLTPTPNPTLLDVLFGFDPSRSMFL